MTAVHATPGLGGSRRRRRLIVVAFAVALIIIAVLLIVVAPRVSGSSSLNCGNASEKAEEYRKKLDRSAYTPGPSGKKEYEKAVDQYTEEYPRARDKAEECKTEDTSSTTTAPPSGGDPDSCEGVTFSPYAVAGTQRFGPAPVDLGNPGSAQDVANAFTNQLKTNRWLSAAWSQGSYLVKGGIGTGEVQAKAQSFVSDRKAWRATNAKLRAILGRSTFGLRRSAEPYKTQEAVVTGTNQCVAPAAKDVGLEARGERLLLDIHRAAVDGGGTITVVVDCDGQIHIVEQAPAPAPTPVPERHSSPTPTSPPVTSPPVTAPPPTAPPPTQPPPTVPPTVPPTIGPKDKPSQGTPPD